MDYAVTQFTEHLISASTKLNQLVLDLEKFLKTNVLSWVEILAKRRNLHGLFRASQNLRSYADRLWRDQPSLVSHVKVIDDWATDLSRLVTNFGKALLHDPTSIHFLLPPVCPPDTAVFRQFGNRPGALSVVGHRPGKWTDWVATIKAGEERLSRVSCGEDLIAGVWNSGNIILYNNRTYQEETAIHFNRMVWGIHLTDQAIALCTKETIVLLDLDGNRIWEAPVPPITSEKCLFLLTSTGNCIVAVLDGGQVRMWDKASGTLTYDETLTHKPPIGDYIYTKAAAVCPNNELIALATSNSEVSALCIWNIHPPEPLWILEEADFRLGESNGFLYFNRTSISDKLLFIVGYYIYLYDIPSSSLVKKAEGKNTFISAAFSPSGKTFVTTHKTMIYESQLSVWDFTSLSLLFRVSIPYDTRLYVEDFLSDASSVVCTTDTAIHILAPAEFSQEPIVGDRPDENAYDTKNASNTHNLLRQPSCDYEELRRLRTKGNGDLQIHPSEPFVFISTFGTGQIVASGLPTSAASKIPLAHILKKNPRLPLAISQGSRRLIATDSNQNEFTIYELSSSMHEVRLTLKSIENLDGWVLQMQQLCFDLSGNYLLVSDLQDNTDVYHVDVKDASLSRVGSLPMHRKWARWGHWFALPPKDGISGPGFAFYTISWSKIRHRALVSCYDAESSPKPSVRARAPSFYVQCRLPQSMDPCGCGQACYIHIDVEPSTNSLVLERFYHEDLGTGWHRSFVVVYDMHELDAEGALDSSEHQSLKPINSIPPTMCRGFLGIKMGDNGIPRLYFIDNDFWLSSMIIRTVDPDEPVHTYTQHMYIPEYLFGKSCGFYKKGTVGRPTPNDIVFFSDDALLVFEGALKFCREVPLGQSYVDFMSLQRDEGLSE